MGRRSFLELLGAGGLGSVLLPAAPGGSKKLRGIFPIMQTPFTDADKLDLATLAKQVHFLERCGTHGMVWPQLASEYATLSKEERLAGAEAILAAGKSARAAIVIGVQASDIATATQYARAAAKHGADGVIALPPREEKNLEAVLAYYREIGKATDLPMFVQSIGDMSVEFVIRMSKEVPTLRHVKDEAGQTLPRITEFGEKAPKLTIFTGGHGRTLLDEMMRGVAGTMPAASVTDLYASVWDLWQAGKRKEATARFGELMLLITEFQAYGIESLKYVLHVRGVFPNYRIRPTGKGGAGKGMDEHAKRALREMLDFVKPHLKA